MQWLNWKGPPPTTHFIFLFCLCNSGVLHLSFSPRFVCFLRFLCRRSRYLFLFLNCAALFSFNGHTIITPVLFLSIHHLSLRRLNPLLLCLYISLPPVVPLFLYPQLCYFLLCMEDTFSLWLLGK